MKRIRLGMVGGGMDAFIGAVHRIAARIDDRYELLAGALSSTPEKSRASGEALGLPRIYNDFKEMAQREARRRFPVLDHRRPPAELRLRTEKDT